MVRTTSLKEGIRDLVQAICQVIVDSEGELKENGVEER
jgi:hypothetical protein